VGVCCGFGFSLGAVWCAWEHVFVEVLQAYRFALDPTAAQERKLCSHGGAARFAYNFGLALVKRRLDARERGEGVVVPWSLAALRREWNAAKDGIAPWWPQNSKEAASSGLADLADGFKAWDSKRGERAGPRVGFPRFKRRGRARESFRYTTGSFGVSGRTRVKLPRIGHVRTHEPTTKLGDRLERGEARILSATISRDGERWFCSFCCEVERFDAPPAGRGGVVGVDVGVRHLAVLSTGEQVENPRALAGARRRIRRLQRKGDRQRRANNPDCYERGRAITGKRSIQRSNRQRRTERHLARLHAHARNIRRDALHKLTSGLAREHGTIVVERLNARGLCRAGNRGLRRAIHDASLAEIRRQLSYKTAWRGGTLIQAPTFYPSSKTCSECGTVKAKLSLGARIYHCEHCGLRIDRDLNAARNLKALADRLAGSGPETKNARSRPPTGERTENPCKTRPRRAVGRPRSPHRQPAGQTGTVTEQSEAA
jgi:putative transposase